MNINQNKSENKLIYAIEGRIDTKTAPELEAALKGTLDGITELVFDFTNVSYISSAGLRVLLIAQKQMNKQGSMTILHANEDIMEIFEVTGFSEILTIQ